MRLTAVVSLALIFVALTPRLSLANTQICEISPLSAGAVASDPLAAERISFVSPNANAILNDMSADLKSVFEKFVPVLDSSSRIVSPPVITGLPGQPHLEMAVEKCVLFICKTVWLRTDISMQETTGPCLRNLTMQADLSKSDALLSNIYSTLNVELCLSGSTTDPQVATILDFAGSAEHAGSYRTGPIQSEDYQVLKLQTPSMIETLKQALILRGAIIQ